MKGGRELGRERRCVGKGWGQSKSRWQQMEFRINYIALLPIIWHSGFFFSISSFHRWIQKVSGFRKKFGQKYVELFLFIWWRTKPPPWSIFSKMSTSESGLMIKNIFLLRLVYTWLMQQKDNNPFTKMSLQMKIGWCLYSGDTTKVRTKKPLTTNPLRSRFRSFILLNFC